MLDDNGVPVLMDLGSVNTARVEIKTRTEAQALQVSLNILMALSLLYTYICYTPIATFQKAGSCLDAQQSMAKQPIKGCVSNHNRMCGKKRERKIRINLKALEETSIFLENKRILFNSLFLFEFLPLSGFWISLFMLLVSSIF